MSTYIKVQWGELRCIFLIQLHVIIFSSDGSVVIEKHA